MEQDGEKKRRSRLTPEQLAEKYEAMSRYEQSAASQGYCRIGGHGRSGKRAPRRAGGGRRRHIGSEQKNLGCG